MLFRSVISVVDTTSAARIQSNTNTVANANIARVAGPMPPATVVLPAALQRFAPPAKRAPVNLLSHAAAHRTHSPRGSAYSGYGMSAAAEPVAARSFSLLRVGLFGAGWFAAVLLHALHNALALSLSLRTVGLPTALSGGDSAAGEGALSAAWAATALSGETSPLLAAAYLLAVAGMHWGLERAALRGLTAAALAAHRAAAAASAAASAAAAAAAAAVATNVSNTAIAPSAAMDKSYGSTDAVGMNADAEAKSATAEAKSATDYEDEAKSSSSTNVSVAVDLNASVDRRLSCIEEGSEHASTYSHAHSHVRSLGHGSAAGSHNSIHLAPAHGGNAFERDCGSEWDREPRLVRAPSLSAMWHWWLTRPAVEEELLARLRACNSSYNNNNSSNSVSSGGAKTATMVDLREEDAMVAPQGQCRRHVVRQGYLLSLMGLPIVDDPMMLE